MTKRLSPRELQIIRLCGDGLGNKEVAERLRISIRTVHTHVTNARIKLGARNTAHAVFLTFVTYKQFSRYS